MNLKDFLLMATCGMGLAFFLAWFLPFWVVAPAIFGVGYGTKAIRAKTGTRQLTR